MKTNKKEIEFRKRRYELGLKYAKSTFIRYTTALLFVVSIYWVFLEYVEQKWTIIFPLIYFIGYIVVSADQYLTLHNGRNKKFILTNTIFKIEIIIDIIFIGISFFDYKLLFSYFSSKFVPVVIITVAILLKLIIIYKIKKLNIKGE